MEDFLKNGSEEVAEVVETPEAAQEAPVEVPEETEAAEEVVAEAAAPEVVEETVAEEVAAPVEAPVVKIYEGKRVSYWENGVITLETGEKMPLSLEDYQALLVA